MKPRLHTWRTALPLLLSSFILQPSSFGAESPLYIPFQGQVTNQSGTVSPDGQYSVIFNLYDQAVGGQPVWSERHVKIGVNKGMINVFLGSISKLDSVDFSQTKYLGITVDTDNTATTADPEMVPRSLIIPSFFSKNTSKMRGYDWSDLFRDSSNQPTNNITTGSLKPSLFGNNSIDASKLIAGSVGFSSLSADVVSSLGGSLIQGSLVPSMTAQEAIAIQNAVAITKDAGNNVRLLKANASVGNRSAFYGFAKGAAASGAPVTVQQFGAMTGFSGLTVGSSYYLGSTDGAIIGTFPTVNPVYVGVALASDTLFVDPFGVTKSWSSSGNYWGNGSDGVLNASANVSFPVATDGEVVVKQYTSLTINENITVTTANRCRGLVIYVNGDATINGTLSMSQRGANVNPTLADSIPPEGIQIIRKKSGSNETLAGSVLGGVGLGGVGSAWKNVELQQAGAQANGKIYTITREGGPDAPGGGYGCEPGKTVANGTGGGSSGWGNGFNAGGSGSAGTCFSGGAGGGGTMCGSGGPGYGFPGAPFGGSGGNGQCGGGGGAGNSGGSINGGTGTGGLLVLIVKGNLTIGLTGSITAKGEMGGQGNGDKPGGSSGGGRILVLRGGNIIGASNISAAGGAARPGENGNLGSKGGDGAVTIDQIDP